MRGVCVLVRPAADDRHQRIFDRRFANAFDGTWALALANGGHDLALTYTGVSAVPEPSTYAAALAALALCVTVIR